MAAPLLCGEGAPATHVGPPSGYTAKHPELGLGWGVQTGCFPLILDLYIN